VMPIPSAGLTDLVFLFLVFLLYFLLQFAPWFSLT
jgi:hypothetical protein